MGNRLSKQDSVTGTENSSYNSANMLLTRGANSYTNDLDGNTLSGGGRTNTWDSENRLAQCVYVNNGSTTTSNYIYGADGLRRRSVITIGSTTTTTDCVLDNSMFFRELRYNAGVAYNYATYLMGPRGPEYRRDDVHNSVVWYVYDGLGSVLAEVNPNGTVTASRKYDVYGGVRNSTGTSTSKHKFVGALGHPSDDESGLIYMRARYMDPVVGRFVSEDPVGHGVNWFIYASDSPTVRIDRTGRDDLIEVSITEDMQVMLEGDTGLADFSAELSTDGTTANIYVSNIQSAGGYVSWRAIMEAARSWAITNGYSALLSNWRLWDQLVAQRNGVTA